MHVGFLAWVPSKKSYPALSLCQAGEKTSMKNQVMICNDATHRRLWQAEMDFKNEKKI